MKEGEGMYMDISDKIKGARQKLMGMGCGVGGGSMSGVVSRQGQTKWMGKESKHPNNNPFESQAQRRFMYSQHPEIAKEFESKTPKGKKLPERKRARRGKGA